MVNTVSLLVNLLPLFTSNTPYSFNEALKLISDEERSILVAKGVDSWEKYTNNLSFEPTMHAISGNGGSDDISVSVSIEDVKGHLDDHYSDYIWVQDVAATTEDVTSHAPIEMQIKGKAYNDDEISEAIKRAGVSSSTSYGGCGPIAAVGILDYFSRYLGYKEIIADPDNAEDRISLMTDVLKRAHFSIFGNTEQSLVWESDYVDAFDYIVWNSGLLDTITADFSGFSLIGGRKGAYWSMVTKAIDEGLPATMFTGFSTGKGDFSQHYTNIYGYETWIGIPKNGGSKIEKQFIKARLNWGRTKEYWCDADILDYSQVDIITYKIKYSNSYQFHASDFSNYFVNSSGGGQYFFYDVDEYVKLSSGITLDTRRLRTSYIENQYLVMSPNRGGAGVAYLDIIFPHDVTKLEFSASLWGDREDVGNEIFKIQYYGNEWRDYIEIDLKTISKIKAYPDTYTVLFPKGIQWMRFYSECSDPSGSRNKGRICLDSFSVSYNEA